MRPRAAQQLLGTPWPEAVKSLGSRVAEMQAAGVRDIVSA